MRLLPNKHYQRAHDTVGHKNLPPVRIGATRSSLGVAGGSKAVYPQRGAVGGGHSRYARLRESVLLFASAAVSARGRRPGRHRTRAVGEDQKDSKTASAGRRETAGALTVGLSLVAAPEAARAGPFVDFLSSILPVREAQRTVADFDLMLREGSQRYYDMVRKLPPPTPDVPDAEAPVAEAAVLAAGDAAASAAGLDLTRIASATESLLVEEGRRLRGRAAAGLFETEKLGSTTMHMAKRTDSYTFRAYCRWRAYVQALRALGSRTEGAVAVFEATFIKNLLATSGLLAPAAFPLRGPSLRVGAAEIDALLQDVNRCLAAFVAVGLCTQARVDSDEVLVELWGEGKLQQLQLPLLVEGDPLVDAQIILSEEFAAPISPDPILATLRAWLIRGSGPVSVSLDGIYVNKYRIRAEILNMTYVPKQRLFQLILERPSAPATS